VCFIPLSPSLKNTDLNQDIDESRLVPRSMKSLDILPLISVVAGLQTAHIYPQNRNASILLINAFYYIFTNATRSDWLLAKSNIKTHTFLRAAISKTQEFYKQMNTISLYPDKHSLLF